MKHVEEIAEIIAQNIACEIVPQETAVEFDRPPNYRPPEKQTRQNEINRLRELIKRRIVPLLVFERELCNIQRKKLKLALSMIEDFAKIFRGYEQKHLAKNTTEGLAKAVINGEYARAAEDFVKAANS